MKLNTTKRKRFRVSNKVKKVASKDRYRLSLLRSSKNIFAQIIDDNNLIENEEMQKAIYESLSKD